MAPSGFPSTGQEANFGQRCTAPQRSPGNSWSYPRNGRPCPENASFPFGATIPPFSGHGAPFPGHCRRLAGHGASFPGHGRRLPGHGASFPGLGRPPPPGHCRPLREQGWQRRQRARPGNGVGRENAARPGQVDARKKAPRTPGAPATDRTRSKGIRDAPSESLPSDVTSARTRSRRTQRDPRAGCPPPAAPDRTAGRRRASPARHRRPSAPRRAWRTPGASR